MTQPNSTRFDLRATHYIGLVGCLVFLCGPPLGMPFNIGAIIDAFGVSNPAFVTMGGALAPMITGFIADRAGFPVLGIFTACAILVGLALCLLTCVKADRLER